MIPENRFPLGTIQIIIRPRRWALSWCDLLYFGWQVGASGISLFSAYYAHEFEYQSRTWTLLVATAGTVQLVQILAAQIIPRIRDE